MVGQASKLSGFVSGNPELELLKKIDQFDIRVEKPLFISFDALFSEVTKNQQ